VLVPNSHLLAGLQSVGGYDSLHPSAYDDYWNLTEQGTGGSGQRGPYANVFVRPQAYSSTLASLLGVRYILSARPLAGQGLTKVYDKEIGIYENTRALPRAFLVPQAEVLDPSMVLSRMSAPTFDPARQLFIERDEHTALLAPEALSQAPTAQPAPGHASIQAYGRDEVTIQVSTSQASWLVFADMNYPGWHAVVDGREQPVFTADYILRAVYLQPGSHTVRFWFQPSFFVPSLVASALSVVLALSALIWPRRR
jgi:uncharacterized membrane protein YfhO